MFRRLSWIVGLVFAFIGGVILAGVFVTSPELFSSGTVEAGDGSLSRSSGVFTGVSIVVLWGVATVMCFGIGFMAMRMSGWLVLGLIPHTKRHHAKTGHPQDDNVYEYDEYLDETDENFAESPSVKKSSVSADAAIGALVTDAPMTEPENGEDKTSPPGPADKGETAPSPVSHATEVGVSEQRAVPTSTRPRVKFGRGGRSKSPSGSGRSGGRMGSS